MAKVTGIPTLYRLVRLLCLAIAKFRPMIYLYYPEKEGLHVAMEAASAACSIFMSELALNRDYGD